MELMENKEEMEYINQEIKTYEASIDLNLERIIEHKDKIKRIEEHNDKINMNEEMFILLSSQTEKYEKLRILRSIKEKLEE